MPPKDTVARVGNAVKIQERGRGNPPNEIDLDKEVEHPKETIPPEYCLNHDPNAAECVIMNSNGGGKDHGAVPTVKLEERPPDWVPLYRSDDDTYAVEPRLTSEGSCLGRDLVTSVESTVKIPTNGNDTRYKLACVDLTVSPGGTPSREMPRCEEDTPVDQ